MVIRSSEFVGQGQSQSVGFKQGGTEAARRNFVLSFHQHRMAEVATQDRAPPALFHCEQDVAGSAAEIQDAGARALQLSPMRFTVRVRQRLSRLKESRWFSRS